MMVYPLESARTRMPGFETKYPRICGYVDLLQGMEGYKRAVKKIVDETGDYNPNLVEE